MKIVQPKPSPFAGQYGYLVEDLETHREKLLSMTSLNGKPLTQRQLDIIKDLMTDSDYLSIVLDRDPFAINYSYMVHKENETFTFAELPKQIRYISPEEWEFLLDVFNPDLDAMHPKAKSRGIKWRE